MVEHASVTPWEISRRIVPAERHLGVNINAVAVLRLFSDRSQPTLPGVLLKAAKMGAAASADTEWA